MGKHPCTAWVPILWGKCRDLAIIKRRRAPHDLPYDIMADILARLPAKFIFQLWQQTNSSDLLYHLTMNSNFMHAHLNRWQATTPIIVVQALTQQSNCKHVKLLLFDGAAAENVEPTSLDVSSWNAHDELDVHLRGSHDGFLIFEGGTVSVRYFCAWNPVTKEQVVLTSQGDAFSVCGFYFHPRKREYEVICMSARKKKIWDFEILNLRSKHRRSVGSCSYPPSRIRWPVFINTTLYWLVDGASYWIANREYPSLSDSILSFSVETEEFRTVQVVTPSNYPPPPQYYSYNAANSSHLPYWFFAKSHPIDKYYGFQLLDMDGGLGLFDPSSSTDVGIWVFNYSTKRWDKKHSIQSPVYEQRWDFRKCFDSIEYIKIKGEFMAYNRHYTTHKLYIYNLQLGTWKLAEWMESEVCGYAATIHTQSVVTLNAADSVIAL